MGACLSTNVKDEKDHCCMNECLVNYKLNGKKQLLKALKIYNAEYILDIIMEYLPTYDLQKYMQETTKLKAYFHQQSLSYYIDRLPPCKKWKTFPGKSEDIYRSYSELKVSILGASRSGKSSICYRMMYDDFIEEIDPTEDEGTRRNMNINDCKVLFDVLDPWNVDEYVFSALIDQWIKESDFCLICFIHSLSFLKSHLVATIIIPKSCSLSSSPFDLNILSLHFSTS